ncbi:YcaO-like family protein [Amycolatopsis magusensis]|uniref:Ribosomal protein S12 methylthiotransferase accessory factor n=1 Tax=Amycolatopsis magusensis TaxID=882444 RepID=A0ABS4PWL8_9PSEU|nr:YcaO-like family protein [Amycolatopsis magusensis]MBP2183824.1 ribosomal protein S12 methylthiotransferase accessory factor [Amycolatopsis magusensis]
MTTHPGELADRKVFTSGTHRVRQPEETWELIRPALADYGITRVADVTGLDVIGIPVVVAVRPLAQSLSVSQGKGQTLQLARISAVMESIEMWHAENACPPAHWTAAPARGLGLPYRIEDLYNSPASLIDENVPLDWIRGQGLATGTTVPVPRSYVQLAIMATTHWRPPGLYVESNGLASGNSTSEALLHALYEVIERDAVSAVAFDSGEGRLDIRAATIDDDVCAVLIERIRAADVHVKIDAIPNRWGLPTFLCFVWSEDFPVFSAGSGTHSSPGVALSRAITEAVQSRLTAISGTRDDLPGIYPHIRAGAVAEVFTAEARHAWGDLQWSNPQFADVSSEADSVAQLVAATTGTEPIVVDLSTSADFAVVKVVCPGLTNTTHRKFPRPADTEEDPRELAAKNLHEAVPEEAQGR